MKRIGKYDIVSILGQGAMGVVYKGFDPIIERDVAIKTVRRDPYVPEQDELRQRFVREAKAAGRLHHPNIISVYECGEDAGQTFIVMEFVNGKPLSTYLWRRHRFNLEEIRDIIDKVLEALDYAHSMNVVHRDIKPSNVMLSENGEIKIADFGIARLDSSTLTRVGTVIGTPSYMSPEQLLGKRVDHRTDLYATGLLLYELLTHKKAFEGSDPNSLMYQVVHSDPVPPRTVCSTLPAGFDPVVKKALAKKPDERFQTGKEFIAAIAQVPLARSESEVAQKDVSRLQQISAYDQPAAEREILPTMLGDPATETAVLGKIPDGKKPRAYGRKGLFAGLVLVIVAIAAALWLVVPRDRLTSFFDGLVGPPGSEDEVSDEAKSPEMIAKRAPDTRRERDVERFTHGKVFRDCPWCPEMVVIPPGSFVQGSPYSETERQSNESPQHQVNIEYPLAVGQHEVTLAEYSRFVTETSRQSSGCWGYGDEWKENNLLNWLEPGYQQDSLHPVTCVSWSDAQAYAQWLSRKTSQTYRLLSSSEWEYVARAKNQRTRNWDADLAAACKFANVADSSAEQRYPGWNVHGCGDKFVHTAPVGSFKANEFGVYDMLGNVFEWVEDCWNASYHGAPADGSPWVQGNCDYRVLRGGSWFSIPGYVRFALRNRFVADYRSTSFGFRVARRLSENRSGSEVNPF